MEGEVEGAANSMGELPLDSLAACGRWTRMNADGGTALGAMGQCQSFHTFKSVQ
jgi:hypothetical protein